MASSINPHAVVQEVHLERDAEKFRQPFSMSIRYGPDSIQSLLNLANVISADFVKNKSGSQMNLAHISSII